MSVAGGAGSIRFVVGDVLGDTLVRSGRTAQSMNSATPCPLVSRSGVRLSGRVAAAAAESVQNSAPMMIPA